jgi:hypothetical protein
MEQFKEDKVKLNLQRNSDDIYECRGRIQGNFPIYLPPIALITTKIIHNAHVQSLHGGVDQQWPTRDKNTEYLG